MTMRAPWLAALVIALVGAGLSIAAAQYQEQDNRKVLAQRLERLLGSAADGIVERIENYRNVLRGVRGLLLVAGPDKVSDQELARYLINIDVVHEFPGARGFGFVRRVPEAGEASYVKRLRNVHRDFAVRQIAPTRGERFIVQLFEPVEGNRVVLGLDLASEPERRRAAMAAMRSGAAQMSAPVRLVQGAADRGMAFLMLLPVYDQGVIPTAPERESHLIGWTYTPLQVDSIMTDLIERREPVRLALQDVTGTGASAMLFGSVAGVLHASTDIEVFGRRWRITMSAGDEFVAQQGLSRPSITLAIGLTVSAALAALALLAAASRQRAHEVRAGQARLAAIVDSSIDAIFSKDLMGPITSWNPGAQALFGHTAQEAIGRTAADLLVPPEHIDEENRILARLADGAPVADLETRRRHKDGHLIDVWLAISPVLGRGGRVDALAVTVRDITERKAVEESVRATNARLEETVASRTAQLSQLNALLGGVLDAATGVAIVASAPDGIITVFNRGAERMLGYRAQEVVGLHTPLLFHDPDEVAAHAAVIGSAERCEVSGFTALTMDTERTGTDTRQWTYVRADGARIAVSLIVSAIRDADGGIDGYLGVAVDITEREELLTSLREAKAQADAASEAKSSFLANMSHEIRTPLNAVLGMLQLLGMTELDTRQHDYATKAELAARALLHLLNDVLDYSKIEAGKLMLDPHPFELDGLMRDLATVLSGNQNDKPVELLFDMDPNLPDGVVGDRMRLQQILINLAGNSLKFTEQGTIKVSIDLLGREQDAVTLRFAVRDTGIGIDPRHHDRIFEGFSQAEASISRRFGGTGLGLVICRRLLEQMGSRLQMESQPGVGSHFWFDLSMDQHRALPRTRRAGMRVLVVDDHVPAGEALLRMVNGLGWDGALATGGAEALALVQNALPRFDVVLLDWRMPAPDGLETARSIESLGAPAPLVLIVTAAGREMLMARHDRTGAAPFAGVLTKPVTPAMIDEAVARAFAPQAAASTPVSKRRLDGMAILLVEDNALNRQVARELLESEGALVHVAEDGREGLNYLLTAQVMPDVVLMDMQMPVMDGLEATRRIRAELGQSLRIIAMTANAGAIDRARCLDAGMTDHLGKPVDLEALVHILRPGSPATCDSVVCTAIGRFGNDVGIYLRCVDTFVPEAGTLLASIHAALSNRDQPAAAAGIHNLKGAAATIGADVLAEAMAGLELDIRDQPDYCALLDAVEAFTPSVLEEMGRQLRKRAGAIPSISHAGVDGDAIDFDELDRLLASGNLRALDIAERLRISAAPDSLEAALAGQVGAFDFDEARVTLARLFSRKVP